MCQDSAWAEVPPVVTDDTMEGRHPQAPCIKLVASDQSGIKCTEVSSGLPLHPQVRCRARWLHRSDGAEAHDGETWGSPDPLGPEEHDQRGGRGLRQQAQLPGGEPWPALSPQGLHLRPQWPAGAQIPCPRVTRDWPRRWVTSHSGSWSSLRQELWTCLFSWKEMGTQSQTTVTLEPRDHGAALGRVLA